MYIAQKDPASSWSQTVADQLLAAGFTRCRALPAVHFDEKENVAVMVHEDGWMDGWINGLINTLTHKIDT